MNYEHYIEDGVTAEAEIMVPISENPVNRAVFNGIAKAYYDEPLQNSGEVQDVWDKMMLLEDDVMTALDKVGDVNPQSEGDMVETEEAVYEQIVEGMQDVVEDSDE